MISKMNPVISLIVMPFGSVNRPSIGVSLLKAGLMQLNISTKVHYLNLNFAELIGLESYNRFAETSLDSPLLGELAFSKFVFPEHYDKQELKDKIALIFRSKNEHLTTLEKIVQEITRMQELIPEYLEDSVYNILKNNPMMIGFTSTFEQNCASLALSKLIKESEDIPIIFGGANCEGEMGASLLRNVPWVDYICSGEGDIAFREFIQMFLEDDSKRVNGIIRKNSSNFDVALTNPVIDMDGLPFPNYDDFFEVFKYNTLAEEIIPELVIETSRGCWWGEKFQCTFCGLNGSTMKYRSKSVARVLDEIKYLVERYNIKKFQVVDNIMDMKYIESLFPEINNRNIDVNLFYEMKSNISKDQLITLRKGGVIAIQPGIESLSDKVLNLMKKGVTALQNIQVLKWCREIGLLPLWNFIWGFPQEPKDEYCRMSEIIPLLVHLHPPSGFGNLTLDRFSPYYIDQLGNGIKNVRPWLAYKLLYPLNDENLAAIAYHFDFDYCDMRDPTKYTDGLKQQLIKWKSLWRRIGGGDETIPVLNMTSTEDNVVMINDTRPCAVQSFQMLANEEARIYQLCQNVQGLGSLSLGLRHQFPSITEEDIRYVLSDMVRKKIIIRDNNRYLSIAVQVN
jgi:ribosomal peptide maturation radical SAM protein 1